MRILYATLLQIRKKLASSAWIWVKDGLFTVDAVAFTAPLHLEPYLTAVPTDLGEHLEPRGYLPVVACMCHLLISIMPCFVTDAVAPLLRAMGVGEKFNGE